ncbi:DUF3152 domain-containing protein [Streptomyces sp. SID12488]|uniref:DUF3152 domain-containing protein n=1 Tax=Streptomyces sp. SID12488 TaxID=2706040 RepID=UPI0013DD3643|nr:DUF3152 domain-containing protein [Streptomyces sp. SID12488]NEA62250.1 DUF3152 domain-containing protein [Streptomyces sp. SID12488]
MSEQRRAVNGSRRLSALRRRQRRRNRIGAIGATVCLAALGTAAVPVLLPRLLPDTAPQARAPEAVLTPAAPTPAAGTDGTSPPADDSTAGGSPEGSESPKSPAGGRTSGSGKGSSGQPTIPASGPGTFRTAPLTGTGPASGTPFRVQVEDGAGVDPADAARQIAAILEDQRGWRRAGASFRQVTGAEAELTFRVATAKTTDKLCNVRQADHIGEVNCRTGADVVINLKRWQLGSPEFDGPPVEYRALIVNHEVGHWLGRGHLTCPGPGRPAPAMMQQIDGLKGCVSNAWPYDTQGRYLNGPAVP